MRAGKEGLEPEVCVAFSPRFERIWLESKVRFPGVHGTEASPCRAPQPCALNLYGRAKRYL